MASVVFTAYGDNNMVNSGLKVLVGNDDGINSEGIDILTKYAKNLGEIMVIAPETQQSAKGKSMTFDKPIRINKAKTISGYPAYSYNASPSDSIIIYEHLMGQPDVVLSGLNAGDNTSIHSIMTSGTCAVAMEAGLKDIPAFAFSIVVPPTHYFSNEIPGDIEKAAEIAIEITRAFLDQVNPDFWKKVMFVNVNFPDKISKTTKIKLTEIETYKYDNHLIEKVDPKGEKYYWLWGNIIQGFDKNKDSAQLFFSKNITVSPVSMVDTDYLFGESSKVVEILDII